MNTALGNTDCTHRRIVRAGFTLVEVIVALTIISVALSVFIALFISAVRLAAESRDNTIASEVAEAYLSMLSTHPDAFHWQMDTCNEHGLFEITCEPNSPLSSSMSLQPTTVLATRNAQERIISLYNKFHCKAWGRLSSPDAASYEITVSVSWFTQGRQRLFALTSSIPRYKADITPMPSSEKTGDGL